jgi:hypothetical protein
LIKEYIESWLKKRIDYELQAKGRAKINNTGWKKLKNYHLRNYIKQLDNPFGFLFQLKYKHRGLFKDISCANRLYYVELDKRNEKMGLTKKEW